MHDASLETPPAPKGLGRLGLMTGAIAVVVVAGGIAVRMHDESSARAITSATAVPTVQVVRATAAVGTQPLILPGTLQAWNEAHIFARVPGYVHGWTHDIGAAVSANAPLATIDTPDLDQQIIEARAALGEAQADASLAKITAQRWTHLLASQSVSAQEADEKTGAAVSGAARVRAAQAALGRLLALKAFATVRAPFAGTITTRNADIGDLVGPGATAQQPLFSMADDGRLRLYVNVPQAYSAGIRVGQTAALTVPEYPGRSFQAAVTGASGALDVRSGTLQVELTAANPGAALRAGEYAQVRFDLPGGSGVTVPATTLVLSGPRPRVAVVTGGRVHLQAVTIGRDMGATVTIAAGLKPGTPIVDSPPDSITEGQAVKVAS